MLIQSNQAFIDTFNSDWSAFLEDELNESDFRLYYVIYLEDNTYNFLQENIIKNIEIKKIAHYYLFSAKFVANKSDIWEISGLVSEGKVSNILVNNFRNYPERQKVLVTIMGRYFQLKMAS